MSQQTTSKPENQAQSREQDPELQNEGEGSRSAARRYDAGAERAAEDPDRVKELAKKAKEELEGPEGQALRDADEQGKRARRDN